MDFEEKLNATHTQIINQTMVAVIHEQIEKGNLDPTDTLPSRYDPDATLKNDTFEAPIAPEDFAPGTRIYHGRYELLEELGSGATAQVWKAVDTMMGVFIALKILKVPAVSEDKAHEKPGTVHHQARREVCPGGQAETPQISFDELAGNKISVVFAHRRPVVRVEAYLQLRLVGTGSQRQFSAQILVVQV